MQCNVLYDSVRRTEDLGVEVEGSSYHSKGMPTMRSKSRVESTLENQESISDVDVRG